MTEQEKDVQMQLALQDAKFNVFMQEMRDRDKQRATEISELRQKQDDAQAKHDADIKELWKRQEAYQEKHDADMKEQQKTFYAKMDALEAKMDTLSGNLHNLTLTAMVGVGTAVIAVIAMVGTTVYSILTR